MKTIKRLCSMFLIAALLIGSVPVEVFAATSGNDYSIANDYINYTINSKTGGFCIETIDGHPQKSFDNNIPLLYKEDAQSNGTSFTTVRIDDKDYIFGQDYGWFGIDSKLYAPIISDEGRLITVKWEIKGYEVTQRVAISMDENNSLAGNVGISYEVKNNNKKSGKVGIRVMLDAALDNQIDAPYVVADSSISPTIVETEYSNDTLPQQIRFMDSVSSPSKMAYVLLSGWSGNDNVLPDKVIVGHWANLANTRYTYAPDASCDFSNYSNSYRTADTAAAFYWSENELSSGETRTAEILYGIGNFSSQLSDEHLGIDMNVGSVNVDNTGKAYKNGGAFKVNVTIDNSVDGARNLITPLIKVTLEDGLIFEKTGTNEYQATYEGGIAIGNTKTLELDVIASPQYQITSKRIVVALNGTEYVDDTTNQLVEYSANRNVLLPAVGGILPDIQMTQISPDTVYYDGEKSITISGKMSEFSALGGSVGWDLYLVSQSNQEEIKIDKKNVAFTDDTYETMSFSTDEELAIGKYNIVFKFTDEQLKSSFGSKVTAAATLDVSLDPIYRSRSYGLVAMIRFSHDGRQIYDFISFADESAMTRYLEGNVAANGLKYSNLKFLPDSDEVLTVVRGKLREMTGTSGENYYQANPTDGDITINNILTYCADKPLVLRTTDESAEISGDGTIKVINSINIWHNEWSIAAEQGSKFTLDQDAVEEGENELEMSLNGAGSMLQYIGGFLIDLKYGVLSCDDDLYGINFGGKITLPISGSSKSSEGSDDEDEDEDKAEIGAEINSILYGERSDEPVGFVGIDATFSVGLPENVLGTLVKNAGGIEAEVTINTIDNYYKLDFGVSVTMFECQGIIAFKQVPIKSIPRIVPDEIFFKLSGDIMQIPIYPPFIFMTGLGGGVSDLADTMSDELEELPPITLKLYTQLLLVETLNGDFDASISLAGMSLEGEFKLVGDDDGKIMKIAGGISARWASPFSINIYGNISVYAGLLKGGITVTITEGYFYGYVYASLCIPDPIPLVGGMELAGIEGAVSSDFIGANVKIIGIKFGFIYYWDGDYRFGKGIDLSSRGGAVNMLEDFYYDESGNPVEYMAMYGTNMRRLSSENVGTFRSSGASIIKNFDPSNEDALLFEVPFTGTNPSKDEIILESPSGNLIDIVPGDDEGNGNFLVQDRGEDGKYIYITITDPNLLVEGDWKLTVETPDILIESFEVNGVDNMPELSSVSYSHSAENSKELKVSWTTDSESNLPSIVDIYLTKNADAVQRLHTSDSDEGDALDSIARVEIDTTKSGSTTVEIPDTYADGNYYVVAMLSQEEGGMSTEISNTSFEFVNDSLPEKVDQVSVAYGGNGNLKVDVIDAENIDYNYYMVSILDKNKMEIENGLGKFAVGSSPKFGAAVGSTDSTGLKAGETYYVSVSTLREADDSYYYSIGSVISDAFVMPEVTEPKLISVSSNINENVENTNITKYEGTYKFDQPVSFKLKIDGKDILLGTEYKNEWNVIKDLEDGIHLIDFQAENIYSDTVSGDDFTDISNSQLGFCVDSQPPVLTIGETGVSGLDENATDTTFSNQTVFMDEEGQIVLNGLTEKDVQLTFDGSEDGVVINQDGTFAVTKMMDLNKAYDQKILKAIDKAGNETILNISVVNSELAAFESVEMISSAKSQIDELSGIKYIEMSVGSTVSLKTYGIKNEQQIEIDSDNIDWYVLYEQNIIKFEDGVITAVAPGESAIRASYKTATYDAEGMDAISGTVSAAISDVIVVKVTDPGYRYKLYQTGDYTLIYITASQNMGALTVTVNGKTTMLLYNNISKMYVGAFVGTVSSEDIIKNMNRDMSSNPVSLLWGDADNDGQTNSIDMEMAINSYLKGTIQSDDANMIVRTDMNGDHVIDIIDAQLILLQLIK